MHAVQQKHQAGTQARLPPAVPWARKEWERGGWLWPKANCRPAATTLQCVQRNTVVCYVFIPVSRPQGWKDGDWTMPRRAHHCYQLPPMILKPERAHAGMYGTHTMHMACPHSHSHPHCTYPDTTGCCCRCTFNVLTITHNIEPNHKDASTACACISSAPASWSTALTQGHTCMYGMSESVCAHSPAIRLHSECWRG